MSIIFTASRSASENLGVAITIPFSVGGTASFPGDYAVAGATSFSATSGSLTIPAGQTSASLTVTPVADTSVEPNESIILTPQAVAGVWAVGTGLPWTGTILNDDVGGGGDPYFGNVIFLLRANASGFYDLKGRSLSYSGVSLSTTAQFGRSISIQNGFIQIPNPDTLLPSVGDWTIEWWYRHVSASPYGAIFSLDGSDYPLTIYYGTSVSLLDILVGMGTNSGWYSNILTFPAPSTIQSDYYALKRQGGTISAWKNGVQTSSDSIAATLPIGIPSGSAFIGANSSNYTNGYYEEFRISNIARDVSIVPTTQFPTI
jgi:Concanavalin A-like lectin/glucanases superfamily